MMLYDVHACDVNDVYYIYMMLMMYICIYICICMMHLLIFLKKWARLYDPSNLEVFLAKMLPAGTVRAKSSTRPAYCAFSLVPDREIEGIRV